MTYILPQPLIFQDFELTVAPVQRRLNAFLFGPLAQILRYGEADEKAQTYLGVYDHLGVNVDGDFKTCYPWPSRPAGGKIDPGYTKLFIDDALLRIFSDLSGTMEKTAANKIRHPSVNFAENVGYPRNVALLRDIKVGDAVTVSGSDGTDDYTLYTYVRDVEGDVVAAVIAAAVAGDSNAQAQSASNSKTADAANSGQAVLGTVTSTNYDGLADGNITETYTVECIESSVGGDPSTAVLRVTSASGNDDDLEVVPNAFASPTPVGNRGLTLTFTGTAFVAGDSWTVVVHQAWTATIGTKGGTYLCDTNKKYIVLVTKGGKWADMPEITVTTQDGSDFSGPTVVGLATGPTTTTVPPSGATTGSVPVGTCGVTIAFSGTGLSKGDRFIIDVTAAKESNMRTLVLAHNLDDAIPLNDAATSNLQVAIYIKKNIEVGEKHLVNEGDVNFEVSDTEICVFADLYATDAEWVDGAGEQVPVPVINDPVAIGTNKMYVEYRCWLSSYAGVNSVSSESDLEEIPGPLIEANTLKWGLLKAVENNNGQDVRFATVSDPEDVEAWLSALDLITDRNDLYNVVPLTYNPEVLAAVAGHVESQSTELAARWRCAFFGLEGVTEKALVTAELSADGEVVLATTQDDPSTSGSQNTLVNITSGNAAIVTADVVPGDILRYQYRTDAWGDVTYNEYVIDEVINEASFRLVSGTQIPESVPIKMEIHRNLDRTAQSVEIRKNARQWDDRRIKCAWYNRTIGGQPVTPNYFVAAAWAAAIGGVVPHQSLTRSTINGFGNLGGIEAYFNRSQLDGMAENGVWLQVDDPQSGTIICRHAVTTADYTNLKFREEMYTRNVDSISYYYMSVFEPYIGKANATDAILDVLEAEILAGKEFLRRSGYTELLGGQLIDAKVTDLRISPIFKDRVVVVLDCELPFPLNNIELHLVV